MSLCQKKIAQNAPLAMQNLSTIHPAVGGHFRKTHGEVPSPCPPPLARASVEGIIRPFQLKLVEFFNYSKMQEFFFIPVMCIKSPLDAYLETNAIFNFYKTVLSYVKTVMEKSEKTVESILLTVM